MTDSIGRLIAFFNKFPGVGNKSARRMAFYLLRQDKSFLRAMGSAIAELKDHLFTCSECGNISDSDPCPVCKDRLRDRTILCVVESIDDLASFEQAGIYNGLYHVLGGKVSPFEDQELSEPCVNFLLRHLEETGAREIIVATNPRMEGDLTYFTLLEILKKRGREGLKISRLAFGLPVGGSIEFADRMTLHMALESRVSVGLGQKS
ncbi:MAG: recombination mediator RecR [Synergistaceae bacterium]|nr:recombination mediator RecR [Synergistaceae bacterium]